MVRKESSDVTVVVGRGVQGELERDEARQERLRQKRPKKTGVR